MDVDVLTGELFEPGNAGDDGRGTEKGSSLTPVLDGVYDDRRSLDIKNILQPKTVTYACYRFTKLQRAILVHIREELTYYLTRNIEELNANELITIPLFVEHYPSLQNNGQRLFETVSKMMPEHKNFIYFEWNFNPEEHSELFQWMQRGVRGSARMKMPTKSSLIQQTSAIIINVKRCVNDPGKVIVSLNPQVLPFLLYYGSGVGGSFFDRDLSLRLNSSFSARLYEMIMDWSTSCSSKVVSLDELRRRLVLPEKFRVNDIKERVLEVAKEELEREGCPVKFDYELQFSIDYGCVRGSRGRYPYNCVVFSFEKKEKGVDLSNLVFKQIFLCLQGIADNECMHKCESLARQIMDNHQDSKILSKFLFYGKKQRSGGMSSDEFRNTMLKIVREMTGVDLRSGYHIRNAARAARRSRKDDVKSMGSLFGDD